MRDTRLALAVWCMLLLLLLLMLLLLMLLWRESVYR